MLEALDLQTTDGEIAVINLESARRRSWNRLSADPLREGVAETVLEHEQLTAQFGLLLLSSGGGVYISASPAFTLKSKSVPS